MQGRLEAPIPNQPEKALIHHKLTDPLGQFVLFKFKDLRKQLVNWLRSGVLFEHYMQECFKDRAQIEMVTACEQV